MASITLEYNTRNKLANKIIEIIVDMDIFKVKSHVKSRNSSLTRKAIEDVEKGNVICCENYEDYINKTSQYV